MRSVEQETQNRNDSPRGFFSGTREFFLPDRLRPSDWEPFDVRWALLLAIACLWLLALKIPGLWPKAPMVGHLAYSAVAAAFLLAGVSLYGWRRLGRDLKRGSPGSIGWHVLLVTVATAGMDRLIALGLGEGGAAPQSPQPPQTLSKGLILAALLSNGLLRPAAEEFAVRFVCYRALRTRLSFVWAALICSAAFGLLHLNLQSDAAADVLRGAVAGLLFSWAYERTGSILTPLGVHLIINLMAPAG
jgi:membrane protease YdiL (CAAX protease family)